MKAPKVPKKFQKLHNVSLQCIAALMKKGMSFEKAEDAVMEILKEHDTELMNGQLELVIASLKMVFLDASVEDAAKDIIKNTLMSL